MKIKQVMLFAYDFPHKKTQDFIFRLISEGYLITYVIATPWEKLNIPKPAIRIIPNHTGLIHPRLLSKTLKIPYIVAQHNSRQSIQYLKAHPTDIYIVSGARILSQEVIKATGNRILNIHPGLLPEVRGLDTLLWSIYKDIPLGLSAHFLGQRIDSGLFIFKERLRLYADDSILDVSLRLLESQPEFLIKTLKKLKKLSVKELKDFDKLKEPYHHKMAANLEKRTIGLFKQWLKKYAIKT